MNCPSRNDDTTGHPDWNQSPPSFAADTTTQQDLNGIANSRSYRNHTRGTGAAFGEDDIFAPQVRADDGDGGDGGEGGEGGGGGGAAQHRGEGFSGKLRQVGTVLRKYSKFIGPGFMVSVAYIDPGNYSTDVSAGASYRFKLLFVILMSNVFAIFLQALCVKLGTVTGLDLAEHCKQNLPAWLNIVLYLFAEAAIIATDIAEVGLP
jgi:metal iron transporter